MILGEDSFFNALAHIMWDMEVDIFSEKEKTLALVADFVPKCKKQLNRLRAMYECGAMELIEQAIDNKDDYADLMWQAADSLAEKLGVDEEKAVFAVNQIIAMWDGELPELDTDDTEEGEGDMIFLQDTTDEENTAPEEEQGGESGEDGGSAEESVLSRLVRFWCESDCEEGRPHMAACPIGWIYIILCTALGAFMVYDITLGDLFAVPVFVFMFVLLTAKRHYLYKSAGRFSIVIGLFYLAAAGRALWAGSGVALRCLPIIAAALVVFNNGRFSVLLDGQKRRPVVAYLLIFLMSAAIAAGVFAIQNVQL